VNSELQSDQSRSVGRRNITVLFVVSMAFGLGHAVYENALPLYLDGIGVSTTRMGWIYAAAILFSVLVRVSFGAWSDIVGRRIVYAVSMLGTGLMSLFSSLASNAWLQGAFRSVIEPSVQIRETMHSTLVYEESKDRFVDLYGKTRSGEFLFRCLGLLLAAYAVVHLASRGVESPAGVVIGGAGVLLLAAGIGFAALYREHSFVPSRNNRVTLRDVVRPDLGRSLWVLLVSFFIFNIGLRCSHSFALQLFFRNKFQVSDQGLFIIMALHGVSFVVPLYVAQHFIKGNLKRLFIILLVVEGLLVGVPGFIPNFYVATAVWLTHDFFGAGLWMPLQHKLLQHHARPDKRGKEVSIVLALGTLGGVFGPVLAGWLMGLDVMPGISPELAASLPFIVGGAIMAVSAAPVLLLRADGPQPPRPGLLPVA